MIACPNCEQEVLIRDNRCKCRYCGRDYPVAAGVVRFAAELDTSISDYDAEGLDRIARVEGRHFWFRARLRVITRLFRQHVEKKAHVIEVGAGTGGVALALQEQGYRVAVGELHLNGLRYARETGLQEAYQFDLMAPPFREHFDAVGMFDVLEHMPDDRGALRSVRRMLRDGGKLVVTVPAYPTLWSQSDRRARHKRRYGPTELKRLAEASGFRVLALRGFFVTLLPMLVVRALLFPDRASADQPGAAVSGLTILPVVNELILGLLYLEGCILSVTGGRIGASLAMVAEKE